MASDWRRRPSGSLGRSASMKQPVRALWLQRTTLGTRTSVRLIELRPGAARGCEQHVTHESRRHHLLGTKLLRIPAPQPDSRQVRTDPVIRLKSEQPMSTDVSNYLRRIAGKFFGEASQNSSNAPESHEGLPIHDLFRPQKPTAAEAAQTAPTSAPLSNSSHCSLSASQPTEPPTPSSMKASLPSTR